MASTEPFKRGYLHIKYSTILELRDSLVDGVLRKLPMRLKYNILTNCIKKGRFEYINQFKELSIRVLNHEKEKKEVGWV